MVHTVRGDNGTMIVSGSQWSQWKSMEVNGSQLKSTEVNKVIGAQKSQRKSTRVNGVS